MVSCRPPREQDTDDEDSDDGEDAALSNSKDDDCNDVEEAAVIGVAVPDNSERSDSEELQHSLEENADAFPQIAKFEIESEQINQDRSPERAVVRVEDAADYGRVRVLDDNANSNGEGRDVNCVDSEAEHAASGDRQHDETVAQSLDVGSSIEHGRAVGGNYLPPGHVRSSHLSHIY